MRINRGNKLYGTILSKHYDTYGPAYDFLSFNHFEDIEVAKSWITFFRRGKTTLCNK